MNASPLRRTRIRARQGTRVALLLLSMLLVAACSGIPGSGPVTEVSKVADQVNQGAQVTPDPGSTPEAIVRGFVYAAARISLSGSAASAYAAPKQYLTARAAQTWQQTKPASVVILSDQFRIDPSSADPAAVTIFAPVQGTLDPDKVYHSSYNVNYKVTVHLVKEGGQWRISDPPTELLIRQTDFGSVFSARTLYFLDASHSVVVPDRRYLINGGTPASRIITLLTLLLHGPAGVLKDAAESELDGASLRTKPTTDSTGLTVIDLKGIILPTAADKNALAAQVVWTLFPDAGQVSIDVNGAPLDAHQPYTVSSVESFSPDRVAGTGIVASDPYFINDAGGIVDLSTKKALFGGVGTGSQHVLSAAMSAATGTLAAVSNVKNIDGTTSQQLLIGQPLAYQQSVPALKATTLTQPSFSRSGDEVWVVQNGATKNPEIYQVSTSPTGSAASGTGTGTASRAKVGSTELVGKGQVTALVLSPDGVRVAVVAGGKLYLGAIATPVVTATTSTTTPAAPDDPSALTLTLTNLQELRGDLANVGPVAFESANELMVVSSNLPGYRSIKEVKVDGSDVSQATTDSQFGDVTSMAVSVVNSSVANSSGDAPADNTQAPAAAVYITVGQPGALAPVLKLQGSLVDGKWVSADTTSPMATGLFFPN